MLKLPPGSNPRLLPEVMVPSGLVRKALRLPPKSDSPADCPESLMALAELVLPPRSFIGVPPGPVLKASRLVPFDKTESPTTCPEALRPKASLTKPAFETPPRPPRSMILYESDPACTFATIPGNRNEKSARAKAHRSNLGQNAIITHSSK
jgi:hypothetical protein